MWVSMSFSSKTSPSFRIILSLLSSLEILERSVPKYSESTTGILGFAFIPITESSFSIHFGTSQSFIFSLKKSILFLLSVFAKLFRESTFLYLWAITRSVDSTGFSTYAFKASNSFSVSRISCASFRIITCFSPIIGN